MDASEEQLATGSAITADEIALYDRQIRLWGVEAQENIRKADILLVSLKALANEIAKNLVLAGVHSLTIIDHEEATEADLGAQFFLTQDDVGKSRAQAAAPRICDLNPRVQVIIDTADVHSKMEDQQYISNFSLVIATDLDFAATEKLSTLCRSVNKPFYAAASIGFYGYIFADLISHEYRIESDMPNIPTKPGRESSTRTVLAVQAKNEGGGKTKQIVTRREVYSPLLLANTSPLPPVKSPQDNRDRKRTTPLLSCLRALWDFEKEFGHVPANSTDEIATFTTLATQKHNELGLPKESLTADFLKKFLQNLGTEIAPVAACLGGLLAQDVINVIGKRQHPIQNFCLFDGDSFTVPIFSLHPTNFEPGAEQINGSSNGVSRVVPMVMDEASSPAGAVIAID